MKAPFCTLRRLISAIATTMAIRTTIQLPAATISFAPALSYLKSSPLVGLGRNT